MHTKLITPLPRNTLFYSTVFLQQCSSLCLALLPPSGLFYTSKSVHTNIWNIFKIEIKKPQTKQTGKQVNTDRELNSHRQIYLFGFSGLLQMTEGIANFCILYLQDEAIYVYCGCFVYLFFTQNFFELSL